jgi:hypothetical protein
MADIAPFIKTIIVVMMENRSFDHLLGSLRLAGPDQRTDVDGLISPGDPAYDNPHAGSSNFPFEAPPGPLATDLPHERDEVRAQLASSTAAGGPTMRGFVASTPRLPRSRRTAAVGYGRSAPRRCRSSGAQYLLCDPVVSFAHEHPAEPADGVQRLLAPRDDAFHAPSPSRDLCRLGGRASRPLALLSRGILVSRSLRQHAAAARHAETFSRPRQAGPRPRRSRHSLPRDRVGGARLRGRPRHERERAGVRQSSAAGHRAGGEVPA